MHNRLYAERDCIPVNDVRHCNTLTSGINMLCGGCFLQGYEHAKKAALEFLEGFKEKVDGADREVLRCVARTSLRTKLYEDLADQLTDIVVDAVLTIRKPDEPIDLFMVRSHLTDFVCLHASVAKASVPCMLQWAGAHDACFWATLANPWAAATLIVNRTTIRL